ncbi:hypothetical protein KW797_04720 [Candidatus Parcubacteria bacterium]|nr:hypothetical protein [Candidatus Parcubacteria bacterium]
MNAEILEKAKRVLEESKAIPKERRDEFNDVAGGLLDALRGLMVAVEEPPKEQEANKDEELEDTPPGGQVATPPGPEAETVKEPTDAAPGSEVQ